MSVEPVDTSPPKSGCMPFAAPIHAMNVALCASTGAALTSTFHQLSAGKSGRGPGSGPPICANADPARRSAANAAARTSLRIPIHVENEIDRAGGRVPDGENASREADENVVRAVDARLEADGVCAGRQPREQRSRRP